MNIRPAVTPAAPAADATQAPREEHLILFNTRAYNAFNLTDGSLRYHRIDHLADKGRLIGSFCGVIDGDCFTSGWRAPFGGPDFMRRSETVENVAGLIDHALADLRARGIRTVRVLCKPAFHGRTEIYITQALLQRGFAVETPELNYHIDLAPIASPEAYLAALASPARRAVNHALKEPFSFSEAISDRDIATAYNLLSANRARKNRSLRLSLDYLRNMQAAFPGNIRWFLLHHDATPVAAVLQYNITDQHAVIVYWGDDHNLKRSPMNLLAYRVFEQAMADGLVTVDVGISSVDGVPDPGLIHFKQSIGCRPELRLNLAGSL